jgi:hypothetical protein
MSSDARLDPDIDLLRAFVRSPPGRSRQRRDIDPAIAALTRIEDRVALLYRAQGRVRELEAEVEQLRMQLREVLKLVDLQKADLDRYKVTCESLQPNQPERVPGGDLELAFGRVLESFGDTPAANDMRALMDAELPPGRAPSADAGVAADESPQGDVAPPPGIGGGKPKKRRHAHGRRKLDVTNLPVETVVLDPEEVRATRGEGWRYISDEVSERIVFRPGSYIRLRIVRRKWARVGHETGDPLDEEGAAGEAGSATGEMDSEIAEPAVIVAPLPDGVWPKVMGDPSAITQVILSKYDDSLPLHRQERISMRQGFHLPRSTQCGWLGAAHDVCYRIVDAMCEESRAKAFCIATDATGARVRPEGKGTCENWHVFVLIADHDHVVFRYAKEHSGPTVELLLEGFKGYLLADAAPIYDVLYRDHDMIEVCCWFHARRYFWRALASDRERALEALALISRLFEVERRCRDVPMPERTEMRARMARPVLALFDAWIDKHRALVDKRGPLDQAIGYYGNQREALHRFLGDGRLRLDNNISESALRNLVLGRHNWQWFANETGLRWYTTFRSLIASCSLHGLHAQDYLEQVLRLAPHWPVTRMLELSPKYWAQTLARLDARQRAILARPWEASSAPATTALSGGATPADPPQVLHLAA